MTKEPNSMDSALWRGMTQPRVSRRDALRIGGLGLGAAGLGLGAVSNAAGAALPNANVGSATWWKAQKTNKQLRFANWPYYVDTTGGHHLSLDHLAAVTGIHTTYNEVIEDNGSFYQRILPSLSAHSDTGYDLIVLTNNSVELGYLIKGGWLVPLDPTSMVNFNKYAGPLVKKPSWDPTNKYTMAWQSGWCTLAYNKDHVTTPGSSLSLMFNSKYKGKVGMLADPVELGTLGLLALGINPVTSKPSDWQKAATKLRWQRDSGIVAGYYDNSYIQHLKNGDLWIAHCYSGDIFQATVNGNKNLAFMVPTEGMPFWTDNMCIPLNARNPRDAMTAMDYYFSPQTQSVVEYYVDYICPVPNAKNELLAPTGWNKATLASMRSEIGLAPSVTANSPDIFPTAAMTKASRNYYQFKSQTEIDTWHGLFLPIVQGA